MFLGVLHTPLYPMQMMDYSWKEIEPLSLVPCNTAIVLFTLIYFVILFKSGVLKINNVEFEKLHF